MYVSPLQLLSNSQIYVSGDVTVDEGAAIAPGVILKAEPDSKIAIASGACIGMGTILHARGGTLIVEAGVILGTGVLVVGAGKIGANACIGSGVTILNPAIENSQMLAAGSLIGDSSRQVTASVEAPQPAKPPVEVPATAEASSEPVPEQIAQSVPESAKEERSPEAALSIGIMHGQAHLNSLMTTLFPHRAYFKNEENGKAPPPSSSA
ncbi:carbon dioxide concentrating mechanism protein [Kamptonema animale CS-326]|jgi:carbon dioxide concentrating mechanism protein CcmN|uniref:carbon dioxide concentrating mechanism protein n=1 Tax=Kamptonema animale TaxID=92934 RepID=UPI00232FF6CB|nr:carbon dioxide concentrating mechanism protein [Kamptonema animale]MDB9514513.1 carbon dioxide concentrating mechanism protein [Kamptonema animale CS-326]